METSPSATTISKTVCSGGLQKKDGRSEDRTFKIGIDQKNMDTAFAQLTLRIISNQKFAAYDKQGKLVAGDPAKELKVEDIWVFERQISHPELWWKLCGRLSV